MAHVVIIGAGIGGLPGAFEIRDTLGSGHRVTLINSTDYFQFVPSNPWLAVGWRDRKSITIPLAPPLSRRGIELIASPATRIEPDQNRLTTQDGTAVDYDYLVITTGPELAFDQVDGAGPDRHTQSICTVDHAEHAYQAYLRLLDEPGPAIVGALPGASCFGPAYEFSMILDRDLRRRWKRADVPMTFVTPEPYIGHLGLGGVGDSQGLLEAELRSREIKWITNAAVQRVEEDRMIVAEHDRHGEVIKEHELPFRYSMMLPAFRGVPAVAAVEKLCNPKGFVQIDEFQRNPVWPNIYSAGVCIAIPPVEVTPVPTGAPKTGYMIESMISAIATNIAADVAGREVTARGAWNAICLADTGNTGFAFIALPQIPPRNVTWARKGRWVHLAKIAYEKYFMRKMRKGQFQSIYEKYVLRILGLKYLKEHKVT
ncbi:MAG TPA: FAD/NAD(P)-binding oxidoreductase [Gammaproteobacteria bacterium]|nr:FAD/NAD(P)-binding oxidoreductase [Gammaproteobacteria bacterium]